MTEPCRQHTMVAMTSQSHLWRNCCIVTSSGPWLLRRCFKRGFSNHWKQPIYEFNCNWIVISIEIQLMKSAYWMAKIITLSVFKSFKQQSLFRSNLARLKDGGTSPSVVVAGYQFCLTNMADRNQILALWNKFSSHDISKLQIHTMEFSDLIKDFVSPTDKISLVGQIFSRNVA